MQPLKYDLEKLTPDSSNHTAMNTMRIEILCAIVRGEGVNLQYQFLAPGQSGIEDDMRWGYRIRGTQVNKSSGVGAQRLANALESAFKASGVGSERCVVRTSNGIWLDGETVNKFADIVRTDYTQLTPEQRIQIDKKLAEDEQRLRTEGHANPQVSQFIGFSQASDPYKAFVAAIKKADLMDMRQR